MMLFKSVDDATASVFNNGPAKKKKREIMTPQNTGTNLNTTNIFKYFASKRNTEWHYMKVLDRKLSTLKTIVMTMTTSHCSKVNTTRYRDCNYVLLEDHS